MSTQAARSFRFTHSSPQQAFRLIELTPDLLELISSPNAPTLYLKSPASGDPSTENNAAYVNLCTPTKTFRIRQVQSSNSIHIIQPSDGQSNVIPLIKRQNDDDNDTEIAPETITAIAKCGSTLEMQGLSNEASFAAAKGILARTLRVWDDEMTFNNNDDDGDVEMDGSKDAELNAKRSLLVKKAVIDDLPFADSQCRRAWIELCAFVPDNNYKFLSGERLAFQPSAAVKLDIWKRILEGCILHSINVDKQFLVRDLWKAVLGDEADDDIKEKPVSRSLFDAIVKKLAERGSENWVEDDSEVIWSNMDKDVGIKWIGETYLEATAPTEKHAIGRSEFLNAWRDLLPETWRNEASLSSLPEASYKQSDPVSIHFLPESERDKAGKEAQDAAGSGARVKNSRNWHERFKSQRK